MNTYIDTIQSNLHAKVGCTLEDIERTVQLFNRNIFVAKTSVCIEQILQLRQHTYARHMPDVNYQVLEAVDYHSILMYSIDDAGNIVSSARLTLDSEAGFAEDYVYQKHIQNYRNTKQFFAEWGRCIVTQKSKTKAEDYAFLIEHIAPKLGIQHLLIFNRRCDTPRILKKLKGSKVLEETDISLGGKHIFVAMLWSFSNETQNSIYEASTWTEYAKSFMTVTSIIQAELFRESVTHLSGNVVDCGAGCAKIAPYLRYRDDILSYIAIDASPTMCQYGEKVLARVDRSHFTMVNSLIEDYTSESLFDSAVCLNSFYTWPDPKLVLQHIRTLLKPNAHFVLATINEDIDMERLIQEGEPDLIMHPDVEKFKSMNQQLALNADAKLLSLDQILRLIYDSGFDLIECHNRFYMGGLSYFVLKRSS